MTATTRFPEARAPRGMVATPHLLATQSGVAALRAGGNALDAAIAAAATIAVVYPHMNGLGGDNVWLIHDARNQALRALCGIGRAARAATIEWYAARGITQTLPARGGPAALTVPAVVDGWWEAHRYSRDTMGSPLPWKALLADAVLYAREGFTASDGQRTPPPREPDLFTERAPEMIRRGLWPLYHPDALRHGPLVQGDLARTLEAVRDGGAEAFYHGDVARRLVAAAAAAGSPLALEDLAEHRSDWMEPLRIPYAEGQAASFPPPTQGLSALAVLGITERLDMATLPEADYIHVLVEATKLAFDDRDRHLTDPGHMRVDPAELLAPDRLQARARLISRAHARPAQPAPPAGGDTIALVTVDRDGNAVSLIQSLYFTFGSGLMAGDTGVVLQNRGSFFSLDPGHINALAPGKRTMHTLIPSMYLEGGRPRFVYGTMGGEGQPQTQAAILTRRLFRRLGPQAAVEAPRWLYGRTWGAATRALSLEGRYPGELARDLESRGHEVAIGHEWDDLFGHAHCIWIAPEGGLVGGSDPRADGGALGF
ncbi:MAG TPA: gamma-glutamyltransferase family protein [Methylomirabilota bacterium]|nr:gamma-glutamyltransferase family protein [Methylomirabilota bacterium]